MFLPSDKRRVQAAFDAKMPEPFEATVTLEEERAAMRVVVLDPDNDQLVVAQAMWWYEEPRTPGKVQPANAEVDSIAAAFVQICSEYVPPGE